MRVALSGNWADYVFQKGYTLMSPGDLKNYIETNQHLPGIPSAETVKNEGIEVSDITSKLLEKIEELHLYMLQQQEQINEQQKQIDALKLVLAKNAK